MLGLSSCLRVCCKGAAEKKKRQPRWEAAKEELVGGEEAADRRPEAGKRDGVRPAVGGGNSRVAEFFLGF